MANVQQDTTASDKVADGKHLTGNSTLTAAVHVPNTIEHFKKTPLHFKKTPPHSL